MVRWLIVWFLMATVAVGPSTCCCTVQAACTLFGLSKLQTQTGCDFADACCQADANGQPVCCRSAAKPSPSSSGATDPKACHSPSTDSNCCGDSQACRCVSPWVAATLPIPSDQEFEFTLQQFKFVSWIFHVSRLEIAISERALSPTTDLSDWRIGQILSVLQRWNC